MRFRFLFSALLLVIVSFAIPATAYAGIPFFGPIIPPQSVTNVVGSDQCAAGYGMLMMVVNNIIAFLITIVIVFVAPVMIAYAGFLYVANPTNPGYIGRAHEILRNTIIGIVIALSGWMIVDAIMAIIYNPGAKSGTTRLEVWSELITSGDLSKTTCLDLSASLSPSAQSNLVGINSGTLNPVSAASLKGTACDPAAVQKAAQDGGQTLTIQQANIFACIAAPESTCGTKNKNYNWGNGSSAAGPFQVLLDTHSECYENKACRNALGVPEGTKLNCDDGFKGGNPTDIIIAEACARAAANLSCSTTAAACVLNKSGGNFKDWQQDVNSAVQTGCINKGV